MQPRTTRGSSMRLAREAYEQWRRTLNRLLDGFARPDLRLANRRYCSFHVCGLAGFALAAIWATALAGHKGLSIGTLAALASTVVGVFLSLALARKVATGNETLVYYHHEIAVLLASAGLLRLLHQPVLPYLDVTIVALGLFLACGRVGCLMVGCCHGLPHRLGVRYGDAHVAAGLTACFGGVRLFPVQLVESVAVLLVVIAGSAFAWRGDAPGAALAWYCTAYGAIRFCLEFSRGDPERPYLLGLSQPQWISLASMFAVGCAETAGRLPFQGMHFIVTACVVCLAVGVVATSGSWKRRLLHPRHRTQVAEAIQQISAGSKTGIEVRSTSLGIRLSYGIIRNAPGDIRHYAISCPDGSLPAHSARTVADLILRMKHPGASGQFHPGRHGVYHLLVRPAASSSSDRVRLVADGEAEALIAATYARVSVATAGNLK